jgi:hypothetical protein
MGHIPNSDCIEACNACANACDHCATACLGEDNVGAMARCIALDLECADLCRLAAASMSRDGEFARQICRLCADACEACGKACSEHDHPHCRACAQACQACAQACRTMAAA